MINFITITEKMLNSPFHWVADPRQIAGVEAEWSIDLSALKVGDTLPYNDVPGVPAPNNDGPTYRPVNKDNPTPLVKDTSLRF